MAAYSLYTICAFWAEVPIYFFCWCPCMLPRYMVTSALFPFYIFNRHTFVNVETVIQSMWRLIIKQIDDIIIQRSVSPTSGYPLALHGRNNYAIIRNFPRKILYNFVIVALGGDAASGELQSFIVHKRSQWQYAVTVTIKLLSHTKVFKCMRYEVTWKFHFMYTTSYINI